MNHDGWYTDERENVVCQSLPEVDEGCVDRYFGSHKDEHRGAWWYPGNTCMSFVDDVVDACGIRPGRMSPLEGAFTSMLKHCSKFAGQWTGALAEKAGKDPQWKSAVLACEESGTKTCTEDRLRDVAAALCRGGGPAKGSEP